jgi:hypothetical protein
MKMFKNKTLNRFSDLMNTGFYKGKILQNSKIILLMKLPLLDETEIGRQEIDFIHPGDQGRLLD